MNLAEEKWNNVYGFNTNNILGLFSEKKQSLYFTSERMHEPPDQDKRQSFKGRPCNDII